MGMFRQKRRTLDPIRHRRMTPENSKITKKLLKSWTSALARRTGTHLELSTATGAFDVETTSTADRVLVRAADHVAVHGAAADARTPRSVRHEDASHADVVARVHDDADRQRGIVDNGSRVAADANRARRSGRVRVHRPFLTGSARVRGRAPSQSASPAIRTPSLATSRP